MFILFGNRYINRSHIISVRRENLSIFVETANAHIAIETFEAEDSFKEAMDNLLYELNKPMIVNASVSQIE